MTPILEALAEANHFCEMKGLPYTPHAVHREDLPLFYHKVEAFIRRRALRDLHPAQFEGDLNTEIDVLNVLVESRKFRSMAGLLGHEGGVYGELFEIGYSHPDQSVVCQSGGKITKVIEKLNPFDPELVKKANSIVHYHSHPMGGCAIALDDAIGMHWMMQLFSRIDPEIDLKPIYFVIFAPKEDEVCWYCAAKL